MLNSLKPALPGSIVAAMAGRVGAHPASVVVMHSTSLEPLKDGLVATVTRKTDMFDATRNGRSWIGFMP